jgi:predicted transposase YbfD/YdcC
LERRRLKRVAVSPEAIGLCGAWQVLAVRRERIELGADTALPSDELGYYITSVAAGQLSEGELLAAVRGHWQAIEDGPPPQRDVTFREEACRVAHRGAAQVLATLRNLALGLYDLAAARGATEAPSAAAQCRRMTFGVACRWLRGGVHA